MSEEQAKWNVLVYLAGDNNLSEEMIWSLKGLQSAGMAQEFRKNARAIAQYDPLGAIPYRYDFSSYPVGPPSGGAAKTDGLLPRIGKQIVPQHQIMGIQQLLKTSKDDKEKAECAKKLADLQKMTENSADPKVLKDFIQSGTAGFEQHRNLLVLSGHGGGIVGKFLPDEDPQAHITIEILGNLLKEATAHLGKKIDILGMDSCLMSMVEVCYQVRRSVDYLVGAEGFETNTGWPYHRVLEILENPQDDPASFAGEIVEKYSHYYSDYEIAGCSTDLAACDLSKIDTLAATLLLLGKRLTAALDNRLFQSILVDAHWAAQSYKFGQCVDIFDFCTVLQDRLRALGGGNHGVLAQNLVDACEAVKSEVKSIVLLSCTTGAAFQHSHGLSIYFPWNVTTDLEVYRKVDFAQVAQWYDFLEKYLVVTRRERRCQMQHLTEEGIQETPKIYTRPMAGAMIHKTGRTDPTSFKTDPTSLKVVVWEPPSITNPPLGFYERICASKNDRKGIGLPRPDLDKGKDEC